MFQTLKNAWKIPELKSKLLFTLMIIVVYRLGANLPMPWISKEAISNVVNSGGALTWLNTLSGDAFANATLFALSVSPYITASIVIQLLTIAIPVFERWSKEGANGKKKLSMATRITTGALALVTAIGYTLLLERGNGITSALDVPDGLNIWFVRIVLVLAYCAGASIIMWLGEKINEKGIGNGISIILFANIIARLPQIFRNLWLRCFGIWNMSITEEGLPKDNWQLIQWPIAALLVIFFLAILIGATMLVIWFSNSERRIPVQYAKRQVGRKMYGGQSSTLPLKLDMAGVMPVIFASSIVSILPTVASFFRDGNGFKTFVTNYLGPTSFPYIAIQIILIVAFAYFYIMISFNPVEVANNLKNNGGAIPGIRPGRPTVEYIKKILNRITLLGAIFLCVLSGLPMIVNAIWTAIDGVGIQELTFSGTSLLIVVGVALETFREIEAQMTLRNYKGFLD